jgi:hypothetical protein
VILRGDALELIQALKEKPVLIATDPPYAFSGSGDEHALTATVAIVLREAAKHLERGGWMVVLCATSWRSISYTVEAVRGIVEPVRVGHWNKPGYRTKVRVAGWQWASVAAVAFRKGKSAPLLEVETLDHITAPVVTSGRRAELPLEVAEWMIRPFLQPGKLLLDPFAGSGAIPDAAERLGMRALGFEKKPLAADREELR